MPPLSYLKFEALQQQKKDWLPFHLHMAFLSRFVREKTTDSKYEVRRNCQTSSP